LSFDDQINFVSLVVNSENGLVFWVDLENHLFRYVEELLWRILESAIVGNLLKTSNYH